MDDCQDCQGTGWVSDETYLEASKQEGFDPFKGDCRTCAGTGGQGREERLRETCV